jgi:hypothetical protein
MLLTERNVGGTCIELGADLSLHVLDRSQFINCSIRTGDPADQPAAVDPQRTFAGVKVD